MGRKTEMLKFKTGDILAEDAEALVNTVNCVGVMGRGLALKFKKVFPENFRAYAVACRRGEIQPGHMFVFETRQLANPRYIVNFPTKRHWRGYSRIEDIEAGLKDLGEVIRSHGIRSIALPPLGSGLGGLEWKEVRSRIEAAMCRFNDLRVVVFEPGENPEAGRIARSHEVPRMTPGRAALIGLMDRYLRGLLDPFVTLLEVHKLMYFMQIAGQPLNLRYTRAPCGPYAENLRHVLSEVEGHFISGYADGGDAPKRQLELVPGAVSDSEKALRLSPRTRERFDRVTDLMTGFESSFGLELLSTVHWVREYDRPTSPDDLVMQTYAWNDCKKCFSPRQIGLAADVLTEKGWISGTAVSDRR